MVALHAFRSSGSIASFCERFPARGVAVVLTGTDLYGEFWDGPEVRSSLAAATRIVTLQEEALRALPPPIRAKAEVIFQSAALLPRKAKPKGRLDCVVAGHLRPVKDPATLFAAVRLLQPGLPIHFRHYGAALDEGLANEARALAAHEGRYRYLGARPHLTVRKAVQAAHLVVHPSRAEGGANVIVEAVNSGTPVLASRIPGNIGMLGKRYTGYFEAGDAAGLARMLQRALREPRLMQRMEAQCAGRRALFRPQAEARSLSGLVAALLARGAA